MIMVEAQHKGHKFISELMYNTESHCNILTLCMQGNFACFFVVCRLFFFFFFLKTFSKQSFRNNIRVSNSLDPDQARCFVGPGLGPNCLQKLSAYDNSRH